MLPRQHFVTMIKFLNNLKSSPLFTDFAEKEIYQLLQHDGYFTKDYLKETAILAPGYSIHYAGIILDGEIDVIQNSYMGNDEIVERSFPGELIGQAFCITRQLNSFITFRSKTNCSVLFLDLNKILSTPKDKRYFYKFTKNISAILAGTNIKLNKKIQLITQKTLRQKLLNCFYQMADASGSNTITLPFNREQLAQYICAERSSVSRELGRMQDDNVIKINGNSITLLQNTYI